MAYLRNIFFFLLLFLVLNIQGQQILSPNIVQNPSFEEYYNCPVISGQLYEAKYWWGTSCEYFNACANMYVSVPSNLFGFQYAHTGNAYAGCGIYSTNVIINPTDYREAIKTKLNDSLIANKRYCTNFYISLAECSFNASFTCTLLDSMGMLFTKDLVQDSVIPILSSGIRVQNDIFNLDTINWLQISNSFISIGGEQYLTIGNFDNVINWPTGAIGQTYVYIDDVSVCECSFNFSLGNDTTLCNGQSLTLSPNMPNATYTWQDSSHTSTYFVTQAGTYWVRAYFADYNITTTDTINIMYKDCDTLGIFIPNSFTPNGDGLNDIFKVVTLCEFSEFKLLVFNRWGEQLFESEDLNKGWDGTYKGKPVPLGVYVYQLAATIKDTGENIKRTGRVTVVR